jgi:hypothetical protein
MIAAMATLLIGLVGPSRSGKGVVCGHLLVRHGFTRLHAGIAIKNACGAMGLTYRQVDGDDIERPAEILGGALPRLLLEHVGEAVQFAAPLAVALYWERQYLAMRPRGKRIIADGIRRGGEAAMVRKHGGVIIRVDRPATGINPEYPCDATQTEVREDYLILNDGAQSDLVARVDALVETLLRKAGA